MLARARSSSQSQAAIARYAPRAISESAAAFARESVAAQAPPTPARAKALLFAAGRLAAFGEALSLELSPECLLVDAVIERFIAQGCEGLSGASVRTLRSNLRALERSLQEHREPAPRPLGRERAKAPYSSAEIEGFLRLAAAQPTPARRMRAGALLCLGAGAGIVAGELRSVRGIDVAERWQGVVVEIAGKRARVVPVLGRFQELLLEAAAFAGESLICGGLDPGRRNITDALTACLSADPSRPRLQSGRLRSSWLSQCAEAIGLQSFMAAAGIRCSQRLGDIAASLPEIDERQMVALLGGSR